MKNYAKFIKKTIFSNDGMLCVYNMYFIKFYVSTEKIYFFL